MKQKDLVVKLRIPWPFNHRIEVYGVVFGANDLLANSAEDGAVRVWRTEVVEG